MTNKRLPFRRHFLTPVNIIFQFENDFDMEIPTEKIKAMISGDEYIFKKEAEGDVSS